MATNEQHVVEMEQQSRPLRESYFKSLHTLVERDKAKADPEALKLLLRETHQKGLAYFNHWDTFIRNSDLLGAHQNGQWVIGLAEDCYALLETILKHYKMRMVWCKRLGEPFSCSDTAHAEIQRMVVRFMEKSAADKRQREFEDAGLPTYGFTHPLPPAPQDEKVGVVIAHAAGTVSSETESAHSKRFVGDHEEVTTTEPGLFGRLFGYEKSRVTRIGTVEESEQGKTNKKRSHTWSISIAIMLTLGALLWITNALFNKVGKPQTQPTKTQTTSIDEALASLRARQEHGVKELDARIAKIQDVDSRAKLKKLRDDYDSANNEAADALQAGRFNQYRDAFKRLLELLNSPAMNIGFPNEEEKRSFQKHSAQSPDLPDEDTLPGQRKEIL